MLNISESKIADKIDQRKYKSFSQTLATHAGRRLAIFLLSVLGLVFLLMFMPWTQNIRARGYVTALEPDKRPQTLESVIAGRIEKWYAQEGEYVKKGDTIVQISEIKDAYFDPQLLSRTEDQIRAKEQAVSSYMDKVKALDSQIDALNKNRRLKIEQTRNKLQQAQLKVQSDSIDLQAAELNYAIADSQMTRMNQLYEDGLKSLTDLEKRKQKLQETYAKVIGAENKLLASRNDLLNAKMDLNTVDNEFQDKLAKAASDKSSTLAMLYDAEATVTKMQNQLSNYTVRTGFYFLTAPQNSYVTKAIKTGIGETVKEGEPVLTIMPADYALAVEMYVRPLDLPLIQIGQEVQIQFDGWPAIVFSGWPNSSFGTYAGRVVAIDNFISKSNKYRILIQPDPQEPDWPEGVRVGSGASTMALLKDVPIWYELWRQLNGFPPDFYENGDNPGNINMGEKTAKKQ